MSPSKTFAKKHKPVPESVDFDTWKANLARLLKHRSPELKALELWFQHHAAYFAQLGRTDMTSIDALLETVFESTQPEVGSVTERRKHDFAASKIRSLLPEIESAIGALRSTNSNIVPKDGVLGRNFNKLRLSLEEAANQIHWALIFIDRPYMRSANILSHCVLFLASLEDCEVSDPDAYALTSLLMKAHGFSDDELEIFGNRAVETGTIRKRVKAARKAGRESLAAQRAFLEGRRGWKSEVDRDRSVKALSDQLNALIQDSNRSPI